MPTYTQHDTANRLTNTDDPTWHFDEDITYSNTGLMEASITATIDNEFAQGLVVKWLGEEHPNNDLLTIYGARVRKTRAGLATVVFDCVGLLTDPTERVVTFPNSVNSEPIETHPRFVTHLGGKPKASTITGFIGEGVTQDDKNPDGETVTGSNRRNGAMFAVDTQGRPTSFLGFMPPNAPMELRGVRSYYRGSIMCRSTYYTTEVPKLMEPCVIVTPEQVLLPEMTYIDEKGAEKPITRWLHLVTSAEMVGKASIWRVTEEYIAGTNNQISNMIYRDGNSYSDGPNQPEA